MIPTIVPLAPLRTKLTPKESRISKAAPATAGLGFSNNLEISSMADGVNPYRAGTRAGTSGACAPPDRPGSAVAPAIAVPIAVVAVIAVAAVAAVVAVAIIAIVAVAAIFVAAGLGDFAPAFAQLA